MSHYNKLTESEERVVGPLISGQSVRALVTSEVTIAVQNGGSCWNTPNCGWSVRSQVTVSGGEGDSLVGLNSCEGSELSDR